MKCGRARAQGAVILAATQLNGTPVKIVKFQVIQSSFKYIVIESK